MWKRNRRQRIAISQAEIVKKCKLFGPIAQGTRAFREGVSRVDAPSIGPAAKRGWFYGWDMAKEKAKGL